MRLVLETDDRAFIRSMTELFRTRHQLNPTDLEEFYAGIRASLREVSDARKGKIRLQTIEELIHELKDGGLGD